MSPAESAPGPQVSGAFVRSGVMIYPAWDEAVGTAVAQALHSLPGGVQLLMTAGSGAHRRVAEEMLRRWADEEELDLILTVGGTLPAPGPAEAEFLPEATQAVVERLLPGLSEAMRAHGQEQTDMALLDRGVAGIRGRTLLLNLPAGAGPALLFLEAVLHLLPPIVSHLRQEPGAPGLSLAAASRPVEDALHHGLSDAEFAAFLARRRSDE